MKIGSQHFRFDEIDSTNRQALEYANDPSLDGAVFQTRLQTAGRGQHGRSWQAKSDSAILLSVLLFPPPELRRPVLLTALAAVSVCETIQQATGLIARMKWPNDILINRKKVCGILIESRTNRDQELAVVCGMGCNLNQTAADFAAAQLPDASSLSIEAGRTFEIEEVTPKLLANLNAHYQRLLQGDLETLESRWRERLGLEAKTVTVEFMNGTSETGYIERLHFAELEMRDSNGTIRSIRPELVRHLTILNPEG
ncbi:biotin--[acetyl-CoA-carboxylase] ligase [Telmatocola sphagniphila]|uniref:Biotin--[acetyl-CoA-carboxylase] ligase n=1 Tax=Telmatocola sphagniphila TaxID=1123043 RepID=A0A8E6B2H2_9BACT|nr:biotin--[acetyl-CoA-carboxylase] ligase [Telmatocola sphagniphila]QVL30900.1 biotin--[acetyl-CoA-carboxylase] ligase [Telmatocola sphagniphila]